VECNANWEHVAGKECHGQDNRAAELFVYGDAPMMRWPT
jgi:hypothetical protein